MAMVSASDKETMKATIVAWAKSLGLQWKEAAHVDFGWVIHVTSGGVNVGIAVPPTASVVQFDATLMVPESEQAKFRDLSPREWKDLMTRLRMSLLNAELDFQLKLEPQQSLKGVLVLKVVHFDGVTNQSLTEAFTSVRLGLFRVGAALDYAPIDDGEPGPRPMKARAPVTTWSPGLPAKFEPDVFPYLLVDDHDLWDELQGQRHGDEPLKAVLRRLLSGKR